MAIPRRRLFGGLAAITLAGACAPARTGSTEPTATPSRSAPVPSTPSPDPSPAGPVHAVETAHGPRGVPRVALTFHGSGSPSLAEALLREAERLGVKVTVLAVGTWLDQHPAMAERILHGGHDLGNHTLHHYPMRRLGKVESLHEVRGCAEVLRRLTGGPGRWFRASGTQHTTALIRRAAGEAGYRTCLSYDVDTLDYQDPGAAAVVRNALRGARAGSILSMHLGHAGTVTALPELVRGLRAKGLTPVTVGELLA
ncbi:MAG: polysaccharide deacetylase family protein [Streptosporangiales bacterium]|nr:polysaccharide deacetylase family protein [Streptosporangiales bacterium]MBO0892035.1 polysaccharide deacetylase family protein [Acidothermales bacterium]